MPVVSQTEHRASVLIAGRPSRIRDSLRFLLKTRPGIEIIGHADDSELALSMVAEHHPTLFLLDTNLPGKGVATVLREIRANGSPSCCLVLAGDGQSEAEL